MTLYIEYVILDNMVVDYYILRLIGVASKQKFKWKNIFFACLIGTISAMCLPFVLRYKFLVVVYKIVTALLMVLVIQRYTSFRKYFLNLGLLFFFTFVFAGVMIAVLNLLQIEYTISGVLLYNLEFPISVFLILFTVGFWLLKKVLSSLSRQLKFNNYTYNIKLIDNEKEVDGVGFFDSGNMICKDGQAVNIISSEMFFKLYSDYSVNKFLFKNIDHAKLKDASFIKIKSLSKSSEYLTFRVDKFIIDDQEFDNALFAVSSSKFENFDCIINSKLIGGKNE